MFIPNGLREIGLDPAKLYPDVSARPPPLGVGEARIRPIDDADKSGWSIKSLIPSFLRGKSAPPPQPPYSMSEEEQELEDALSPIHDSLEAQPVWWALEVMPLLNKYQTNDMKVVTEFDANWGGGRYIQRQSTTGVLVHRSVRMRMEAKDRDGNKYKPQASFEEAQRLGHVVWVD